MLTADLHVTIMHETILSTKQLPFNYKVKPDRMPNTEEQIYPSTQVPCPKQHHNPSPSPKQHIKRDQRPTNR